MNFFEEQRYVQDIERLKNKIRLLELNQVELEKKLEKKEEEIDHKDFIIRTELQPRIEAEKISYDAWANTDPSAEGCEHWLYLLDEMISMVQDNPTWFDWEDPNDALDAQILYLIKNRDSKVVSYQGVEPEKKKI